MSELLKLIRVTTSFIGFHQYADAPDDVAFLREPHRHLFGVAVEFQVSHNNRQLEFFQMQRRVIDLVDRMFASKGSEVRVHLLSCEDMAEQLLLQLEAEGLPVVSVTVDEDGENGGTVVRTLPLETPSEAKKNKASQDSHEIAATPGDAQWSKPFIDFFVGVEAEGPFRGKKTLFVPYYSGPADTFSDASWKELNEAVEAVYFGAGYSVGTDSIQMSRVLNRLSVSFVTIEFTLDQLPAVKEAVRSVGSRCELLLVLHFDPKLMSEFHQARVVMELSQFRSAQIFLKLFFSAPPQHGPNTHLAWVPFTREQFKLITALDNPLFQEDKVL